MTRTPKVIQDVVDRIQGVLDEIEHLKKNGEDETKPLRELCRLLDEHAELSKQLSAEESKIHVYDARK